MAKLNIELALPDLGESRQPTGSRPGHNVG
jgi:hypothetical protein